MSERCTIEVITNSDQLANIATPWDQIVARAGVNHPFLTHDWISTWWRCFGDGAELSVLLVRAAGEPIAIAPLMRTTERIYGARHRCVRFLANAHTPRCDFLVVPEHANEAYSALCEFLMSEEADWDVLRLRELPSASRTLLELAGRSQEHGFLSGVRPITDSPIVSMQSDWQHYVETLPPKRRWFLRNRLRRLSRRGRVSFETVTGEPEFDQALEDGYRLEAAAWKEDAGTAIRCRPEIRRFYTEFARRAAARGWLRLQFLKVDERRIAFAYCLAYAQRTYLLKPGFDPQFAEYSPGNLLCYLALEDAHKNRLVAYEFLGSADHWKCQWTTQRVGQSALDLYTNRPLTRLAHCTRFALLPMLKRFPFYTKVRGLLLGEA